MMYFDWDQHKATLNFRKHGVSFVDAQSVFDDALAASGSDPDHSTGEHRSIIIGHSKQQRLLVVVHRIDSDRIRLISARKANLKERRIYEQA